MKKLTFILLTASIFSLGSSPVWGVELKCAYGEDDSDFAFQECTEEMLQSDRAQFVFLSAGYGPSDGARFYDDVEELRYDMSNFSGMFSEDIYSDKYKDKLLYVAYYTCNPETGENCGNIDAEDAAFNARKDAFLLRGATLLSADDMLVYEMMDQLQEKNQALHPKTAIVLFDTEGGTANAMPPISKNYGYDYAINRTTPSSGADTVIHECGHSFIGWGDEYVEYSLKEVNIRLLDTLTPLGLWHFDISSSITALFDLLNVYDMNISETYVAGRDNISSTPCPSRVGVDAGECGSEAYQEEHEYYSYEGAYFGKGVWRYPGNSVMNCRGFVVEPHSPPQKRTLETIFEHPGKPGRANDRIRNAGPLLRLPVRGCTTMVLAYDEDKYHVWHPTQKYDVEIAWEEVEWKIRYADFLPYLAKEKVTRTVRKEFAPEEEWVDIKVSALYKTAPVILSMLCGTTEELESVCSAPEDVVYEFLPDIEIQIPYQRMRVPTPNCLKNYRWRFRTRNGENCSQACDDSSSEACGDCSEWTEYTIL